MLNPAAEVVTPLFLGSIDPLDAVSLLFWRQEFLDEVEARNSGRILQPPSVFRQADVFWLRWRGVTRLPAEGNTKVIVRFAGCGFFTPQPY